MKLGDNMTMEAYNIWGDVAPRKCRPPKIGDIPKHSAIDEESPSSISKPLTATTPESRDPSLDIPLDTSRNIVFPLASSASTDQFSSVRRFETRTALPCKESTRFQYPTTKKESLSILNRCPCSLEQPVKSLIEKPSLDRPTDQITDRFIYSKGKVTINLPSEETATSKIKDLEDSSRIPSSPEDISDQEVIEVRKDSALFLEEAEGLPTLREILKSRAPRIIRPRRESSGYASNLGTFDEDRRNSSSADVSQDLSLFFKERRRSSTGPKRLNSRVILGRAEESLTEDAEVERMPTTEVHRKVSAAGLDMPNIEEVKEVLRDELPFRQESLDNLCSLMKNVSTEDFSPRCRLLGEPTDRITSPRDSTDVSITSGHKDTTPIFDTTSLSDSINRPTSPSSKSPTQLTRHSVSSLSSNLTSQNTIKPINIPNDPWNQSKAISTERSRTRSSRINEEHLRNVPTLQSKNETVQAPPTREDIQFNVLPRSVKMYQFLSTQSEDTAEGEQYLDRRISFQISKQDDEIASAVSSAESRGMSLNKSSSVYTLKNSVSGDIQMLTSADAADDLNIRKAITPGEVGASQRFLGDASNVSVRPIYPYCPYSPYGSPQGSPRNRRRPLRESRRVSIDNRQGALQLNQYKLLDNIGQGSYGIVKLAYNEEDKTHYAMKILSKKKLMKKAGIFGRMAPGKKGSANPLAKVYREIALLKKLDHPNVVKLVEVLDDPDEDNLYLVFELVQRGEILQVPTDKPLDEETARKNFRDVVLGVEYLHYQRIVHRDIKPSNLLVDSDGRIKIADLGVSAELRACGELLSGPAGTPAFAAPETTTPGAHYSGTLCDVWSMGVTLYCLVTGRIPWDGSGSIIGVQAAVRTEPLKFPAKPTVSDDLRDLISKMLAKEPTERITLSEIKEHAWLTNHGAQTLPSETDNCRLPVTVTDEEVERVVTRIPKLDTLILIKTMLKQHSFQNPFLSKKSGKRTCTDTAVNSIELSSPSRRAEESLPGRKTIRNAKSERFQRTGRSNSAPDSYDWQTNGRQISIDSPLPPLTEASNQETEFERR
ncbi:PREDICTED: serine/threonine-protein kinase N1-like [Habropoda laboriosa]|uniref:serine/threonine-protein kinase N1-like n=1 Tax=Habropoda laboriosa TaxID=597456 RepID=UPI00083E504C|nr:PREDICTED: serine/threonine-protein kinase N1-like [Habropoda laboriosa]